jgi:hypothetical protein
MSAYAIFAMSAFAIFSISEISFSNLLQRACSGFLIAACVSKSCSVTRLHGPENCSESRLRMYTLEKIDQ